MLVRLITTPCVVQETWIPPIGIAQLAGMLKHNKINVDCIDLNRVSLNNETISDDILLTDPKIDGALKLNKDHSGMIESWVEIALEGNPDIVGLSIFSHGMVAPSFALSLGIKKKRPETTVIMGGPFALPSNQELISHILESKTVDGIFQGEGEYGILNVVRAEEEKRSLSEVAGMWTISNGELELTPVDPQIRLDTLPLADFSGFKLDEYKNAWKDRFPVFGSRGCINECSFCNSRKHIPRFRTRSVEHIMREIYRDVNEYGIKKIAFTDNLINGNPRLLKNLCRAIIKADMGIEIWGSIDLNSRVDEEMLDLMMNANFRDILLAVETPAEHVRKDMGKWPDKEGVLRIVRGAVERRMTPVIYLMHSFPTEREEDFLELMHFVDEFKPLDFRHVGSWPFRLAQVQPGELDMDFVKRFNIQLHKDRGFEYLNPVISFGNEPCWETEWINDDIKIERQKRITKHLLKWEGISKLVSHNASRFFRKSDNVFLNMMGINLNLHKRARDIKRKLAGRNR